MTQPPPPEIALLSIDWTRPAKCRSCGAPCFWGTTQKNRRPILLNGNAREVAKPLAGAGYTIANVHVHFASCPHAAEHRRNMRNPPSTRID